MPTQPPTPPQRLLIVTTELGVGGAERCVVNLACGLDSTRWNVQVVALASPPRSPKDALVRQLEAAGVPLTFLNCRSKWQLLSAVRKLRKIVQTESPDAVLSFLFHANIVATLATRGLAVPQLQSLRVIEQGGWRRRLQAWAAAKADRVLCVSEGVRRFAEETLLLPAEQLVVIPNGIDVDSIIPVDYSPPIDRKHRLIAIGRLDPQKGFDWLIDQVAQTPMFQQSSADAWELVIVGEGSQKAELAGKIQKHGLDAQICLAGWQPDISCWLRDSDIYVLSSRWEGMPNTLLEAMAHGLPVVATNVEGVSELLSTAELRRQVLPPDQEALRLTLWPMMEDADQRRALGKANRRQIEQHFSLRHMLQLYETTLADTIASCRTPR